MENKTWDGKRFHSLNYFLRNKFGCKVFKISLDAGFSCPNRDGKISTGGCVFCSARGSGDFAGSRAYSISKQFEGIKKMMSNKWKNGKYVAYFQAYTNTYAPVETLRSKYCEALGQKDVVAIAIATRPDCLGNDVLDLLEEMNGKVYVWVELGLQTSKDSSAKLINRGYDLQQFEKAVHELRKRNIDVVVHTIFGLPEETEQDMMKTVEYISRKDVQGVKFHLLHLMKNTPLMKLYEQGNLEFLKEDQYIDLICKSITMIPPNMVVHRLTGDAPRELLVGPMWSLKKWEVLNSIDSTLEERGWYQGMNYDRKVQNN